MSLESNCTPNELLTWLLRNTSPVSARWLHRTLEIRQPYGLWLARRVTQSHVYRQPDDFCFVQRDGKRDCDLSPTLAIDAAAGGGSKFAAKLQVAYCRLLADHVFKGQDVLEVFDTGVKCYQAEQLLARSFDPEAA